MEERREKFITVRLNDLEWQMLDELTKKYETKKSTLIRTLILNLWKDN